ncbi:MAG: metal-dependent hydrolase [Thermoplasmata archaeon]|nr:metal-dependent hydrolase [Thermoplasmata archaeon]
MDPFSHLLLGYLLGFGLWGPAGLQYVVAAAVGGALPDADIALFPLSQRFPLLRHRGLSHSLVGVTLLAAVGCFAIPTVMSWGLGAGFSSGSRLVFFVALEVGGLSHVFLDSLDHWSVPILAPFSPTSYKFDVDRIVNVGSMAFTVLAYALLIYERGRVSVEVGTDTTLVLLAAALVYFSIRISARWVAGAARKRAGYSAVIPQGNPLRFVLFREEVTDRSRRLQFTRYHLIRGLDSHASSVEIPLGPTPSIPVQDAPEALARSYAPAFDESWVLGETHPFAVSRAAAGGFDVFWYSLEMSFWGRHAGVVVHVDRTTGTVHARSRWRNPARPFD